MKKVLFFPPPYVSLTPILLDMPDTAAAALVTSGVGAYPIELPTFTPVVGTPTPSPTPTPTPTPSAPIIAFANTSSSVAEGDSGTKTVSNVINVTRNGVTGPLTVNLSYSGTATSGTDYVAGPVSGTIADGQTSLSFDLTINGDTGVESDETIVINAVLDAYSSATASKTITVTNDDVTATPGGSPTITGTAGEGNRLAADPYPWTDSPEYRSGQWYRDGVAIDGATFRSYTQKAADNGKALTYTAKSRLNGVQRTTAPSVAVTPTAAAAFSLDQFPAGTIIDHDPTFGVTADATTGAVSAWAAKRGTGTFTQATAANMPVLRAAEIGSDPAVYFGSSSTVGRALVSDEADSTVWTDVQIIIRGGKDGATQPSVSTNKSVFSTRRTDTGNASFFMSSNNNDTDQNKATITGVGGGTNVGTTLFAKGVPTLIAATTQPSKRRSSINGTSAFATPLNGSTTGSPATQFGSPGTGGPIMSVVRRVRLSLETLAGSYAQLSYHRLLEGHLAWRYGIQAMLPSDHIFANRAPSAADFVNKMANVQTWGNSLTNGFSIHVSNALGYGDQKGNYLMNGGVGGDTGGGIYDRFVAGFDTGAGTTTGEPIAIQRQRVSVIGDMYTNGFGSSADTTVTSTRQTVDKMVAAIEAAQGVTAGNGRIVVLGRWRTPIQALNDPATDSIVLEDNYLRGAYPNYFCDWADYMWSLGAPDGLYPDATTYAKHTIPAALAADTTHPTGPGYQLAGTYIANFVKAKGWDRA